MKELLLEQQVKIKSLLESLKVPTEGEDSIGTHFDRLSTNIASVIDKFNAYQGDGYDLTSPYIESENSALYELKDAFDSLLGSIEDFTLWAKTKNEKASSREMKANYTNILESLQTIATLVKVSKEAVDNKLNNKPETHPKANP